MADETVPFECVEEVILQYYMFVCMCVCVNMNMYVCMYVFIYGSGDSNTCNMWQMKPCLLGARKE